MENKPMREEGLFLRCATKTHAEGVAESMGNIIDIHCGKRRGLDISTVGMEAKIHWNGPPALCTHNLAESSRDSYFTYR